MKAAAMLSLVVAIILGIVAISNFIDDNGARERAASRMLASFSPSSMDHSAFDQYTADVQEAKAAEQKDEILGLVAVTFLIASLVMFSQAKKANS